jgi:hypothetical protein
VFVTAGAAQEKRVSNSRDSDKSKIKKMGKKPGYFSSNSGTIRVSGEGEAFFAPTGISVFVGAKHALP